jgi:dTMP kinase
MGERIWCASSASDRLGAGRWWGLRISGAIGSIAYTREVAESETRRGLFITLEGPDGSGKSSLLQSLAAALRELGCDVVATREPGSTALGEQVRRLVLDPEPRIDRTGRADALLFAASRAQHVDEVIQPALDRGAVVVCDRYADSSLAYQGAGSGVPMDELRAVQRFATGGLVPDLTILLDLPVEAGLGRKAAEVTRFEAYHDLAYHERVRAAFLGFAADEPGRYAIVDATRDADTVLAAALEALARVGDRLPCRAGGSASTQADDAERGSGASAPRGGEPIGSEARMPR